MLMISHRDGEGHILMFYLTFIYDYTDFTGYLTSKITLRLGLFYKCELAKIIQRCMMTKFRTKDKSPWEVIFAYPLTLTE